MIMEIFCAALLVTGAFFMLIAAVGIMRMPDIYMRISATTKATTFGLALMILAAFIFFDDPGAKGRALAIIAFLCLTGPVSAHMIGRAAYLSGAKLWPGTVTDQLKSCYEQGTHKLKTGNPPQEKDPGAKATGD